MLQKKFIFSLLEIIKGDSVKNFRIHFIRGVGGSFALKVSNVGLLFIISVIIARLLGTKDYGTYVYIFAWTGLISVPACFGLNNLLVRKCAAYQTQSAWGLMRGILSWSNKVVIISSIGLAFCAALIALAMKTHFDPQRLIAFWIALVILPLVTLTRLRQAALRGLHYVVRGQMPEMFIQPMVIIVLLSCTYFLFQGLISVTWMAGINVISAFVALLFVTMFLHKALPKEVKEATISHETRIWFRSALPLLFVSGMQVINARTDIIMLGMIKGTEATGIYAAANRGAGFIAFSLLAINATIAPTIASLYSNGNTKRLQQIITKSARVSLLISLPIASCMIFFGYWYLSLFGSDFIYGEKTLKILSLGQVFNCAMGSVGLLLIMTGHERDVAIGTGIGALLNIILNAFLIPMWGIEGAAVATASSMIMWNILLVIWVHKRLGINATALRNLRLRRKV